jgi:hypothetical protein
MTGQVKEDILSRFGELGVFVEAGKLSFKPSLLQTKEFLKTPSTFTFLNENGETQNIQLAANTLCFTYCQTPIIYQLSDKACLDVIFNTNKTEKLNTMHLNSNISKSIFERKGEIHSIIVSIKN